MKLAAQLAYEAGAMVYDRSRRAGAPPAEAMRDACRLVRQTIRDSGATLDESPTRTLPAWVKQVLAAVAADHAVHVACLTNRDTTQHMNGIRQEAAWRLRHHADPKLSFPLIGIALNRDHSSAISAVRKFEVRLASDEILRARIQRLTEATKEAA